MIEPISNRAPEASPSVTRERPAAAGVDGGHGDDDPVRRERPVQRLENSLRPLRIPSHETRRYRFFPVISAHLRSGQLELTLKLLKPKVSGVALVDTISAP